MKIPKITPAHAYNAQAHADAVSDEEAQLAQHRALMKLAQGGAPAPFAPAPAPAPAPSLAPPAQAPAAPAMPGAPAKGQYFPGLMSALRKKKIGL